MTYSKIFQNRKNTNTGNVGLSAYKNVSDYRREKLEEEIAGGHLTSNAVIFNKQQNQTPAIASGKNLQKIAQFAGALAPSGTSSSGGWRGNPGTVRQTQEIYSPYWLPSNINLPRDRATANAWNRWFYTRFGMVQNAISLHSTYPISKLNIKCKDPSIEKFFNEQIEELNLLNKCIELAQHYWQLGEGFCYAILDESQAKWSKLIIQNPDYMEVHGSAVAGEFSISICPDENLKRIVSSNKPEDQLVKQKLDPNILEHVKKGRSIPLSPFHISHLPRKVDPCALRGRSLIEACFQQLSLFDQMRESKYAQAANMINPLTLIQVGGTEHHVQPQDLQNWRQVFEEAQYDKDFKIITHEQVKVDYIGHGPGIYDISGDITQLLKEIAMALLAPQVILEGGGDTTYANAGVTLDVLKNRYMHFRNMMAYWLRTKIFAPISMMREFFEYKGKEKILIVPEIDWNHMSLFEAGDYVSTLKDLAAGEDPNVSVQTLHRSLGIDYKDERRKIRIEAIDKVILKKEIATMEKMSLADLRILRDSPDQEIKEIKDDALPGEVNEEMEEESGGLGSPGGDGMDLGSPGGLGTPPPPPSGPPSPPPI